MFKEKRKKSRREIVHYMQNRMLYLTFYKVKFCQKNFLIFLPIQLSELRSDITFSTFQT